MVPIALGVWGGGDRDLCSRYGGAREQEYLFAVRLQMHLDDLGGFGTEAVTRWGLEFKRLSCDVAIVAA